MTEKYEILQPEGGLGLTPANQKLIDEGYGKWGKSINASVFLANGGTQNQLIYLFYYYPVTGKKLDTPLTFQMPDNHKGKVWSEWEEAFNPNQVFPMKINDVSDPFSPVERGVWVSVKKGIPEEGEPFIYLTSNKKVMVCSNRVLDEWFINKYSVKYWMYVPELPEEL